MATRIPSPAALFSDPIPDLTVDQLRRELREFTPPLPATVKSSPSPPKLFQPKNYTNSLPRHIGLKPVLQSRLQLANLGYRWADKEGEIATWFKMDKASIKKKAAELGVGDVEGKTIKVLARECVMRAGKFETFLGGGGGYFYVLEFRLLVSEEEMVGFLVFSLLLWRMLGSHWGFFCFLSLRALCFSLGCLLLSPSLFTSVVSSPLASFYDVRFSSAFYLAFPYLFFFRFFAESVGSGRFLRLHLLFLFFQMSFSPWPFSSSPGFDSFWQNARISSAFFLVFPFSFSFGSEYRHTLTPSQWD